MEDPGAESTRGTGSSDGAHHDAKQALVLQSAGKRKYVNGVVLIAPRGVARVIFRAFIFI